MSSISQMGSYTIKALQSQIRMARKSLRSSPAPGERLFFAPASYLNAVDDSPTPYYGLPWSVSTVADFCSPDLLLMQDSAGSFWYTSSSYLFKDYTDIPVRKCTLTTDQALEILQTRVLCISETDPRLSDFHLLSPYRMLLVPLDSNLSIVDWVASHLTSRRAVRILHHEAGGAKCIQETKTADFMRAKADIACNPAATRNMSLFCRRQGPTAEGPSTLNQRICHDPRYVTLPSTSTSSISTSEASELPSQNSNSTAIEVEVPFTDPFANSDVWDTAPVAWQNEMMDRTERKHSLAYHLMCLAHANPARIAAEKARCDLRHARREKRPTGYVRPSRMSAVSSRLKKVRERPGGIFERRRGVLASWSEDGEAVGCSGRKTHGESNRGMEDEDAGTPDSEESYRHEAVGGGQSDDKVISPLALPPPQLCFDSRSVNADRVTATPWDVSFFHLVPSSSHRSQYGQGQVKHDSLGAAFVKSEGDSGDSPAVVGGKGKSVPVYENAATETDDEDDSARSSFNALQRHVGNQASGSGWAVAVDRAELGLIGVEGKRVGERKKEKAGAGERQRKSRIARWAAAFLAGRAEKRRRRELDAEWEW